MAVYRYALLERPPMPGTLPRSGLDSIETYCDERQHICGMDRPVWGVAVYTRPLSDKELEEFELAPVPETFNTKQARAKPVIVRNRIRCTHCGDIIESESVHDFKLCSCGTVAVDGGRDYCRRAFKNSPDDYEDLSEYVYPE